MVSEQNIKEAKRQLLVSLECLDDAAVVYGLHDSELIRIAREYIHGALGVLNTEEIIKQMQSELDQKFFGLE